MLELKSPAIAGLFFASNKQLVAVALARALNLRVAQEICPYGMLDFAKRPQVFQLR